MRRKSKASVAYNSEESNDKETTKHEKSEDSHQHLVKNVKVLENVLIQSLGGLNNENSFGINISDMKNGEFKKTALSNFISFNNGETMYMGDSRKASLPAKNIKLGKTKNNNLTFNGGSSFFSKSSKSSKASSKEAHLDNSNILQNIDFIKNIQKETGVSYKDICEMNNLTQTNDDGPGGKENMSLLQ
jgi:hypothetical protein